MNENKKVKLFCIPYSGGYANIFNKWKKYLIPSIELYPLELSGRGKRNREPLYKSFEEAVNDIYYIIKENLSSNDEYILFGHSLGGLLAYEIYYKLESFNKPKHIYISGVNPPHYEVEKKIKDLSKIEFINYLKKLGGISKELLSNKEIIDFFLPIIRSDLEIYENYKYNKNRTPLEIDISVFYGTDDFLVNLWQEWKNYTNGKCYFYQFDGNHFFLNSNFIEICDIINNLVTKKNIIREF